jgi:hypothetical protein
MKLEMIVCTSVYSTCQRTLAEAHFPMGYIRELPFSLAVPLPSQEESIISRAVSD